jgi:hypothetical protein
MFLIDKGSIVYVKIEISLAKEKISSIPEALIVQTRCEGEILPQTCTTKVNGKTNQIGQILLVDIQNLSHL